MTLRVDHVLYAVGDLDDAAARLRAEHGLAALPGGRHPGWGTGNMIVPLGDSYLELIGVVDPDEAASSPFGRYVAEFVAQGDRPFGWCLRPDDLDAVSERLSLVPVPGSRIRPDGTALRWRLAGLDAALGDPGLPFFIAWDSPDHPGRAEAPHAVRPLGVSWIQVGGAAARLRDWLGGEPVEGTDIRFDEGAPGLHAFALSTPPTEISLR